MRCMLLGLLFAASLAALSNASPGVYLYVLKNNSIEAPFQDDLGATDILTVRYPVHSPTNGLIVQG